MRIPFLQKFGTGTLFLIGAGIPTAIFLLMQLINDPLLFVQTFARSLGLGAVYAIVALGFVLIFKATQTVNFAQGGLAVAGALFVSYAVNDGHIPFTTIDNPLIELGRQPDGTPSWYGWALSVLLALCFAAALGLLIERIAIRPMIGEPLFSVAVITLGLEIVLRVFNNDTVKTELRSLQIPWGNGGFTVGGTDLADGSVDGGAFINWSILAAVITAAVAFVAVYVFYKTKTGIAMRAVSFDQEAAMAQGISPGKVFAIAWGAGAVLAAIGGIFATQPPVTPSGAVDAGTANIAFRALPAVILGGLDSASGALVGGLIVGFAEIFAGQYARNEIDWLGAGYSLIVPYVVMLVALLIRPYGLFGTPEIRRV